MISSRFAYRKANCACRACLNKIEPVQRDFEICVAAGYNGLRLNAGDARSLLRFLAQIGERIRQLGRFAVGIHDRDFHRDPRLPGWSWNHSLDLLVVYKRHVWRRLLSEHHRRFVFEEESVDDDPLWLLIRFELCRTGVWRHLRDAEVAVAESSLDCERLAVRIHHRDVHDYRRRHRWRIGREPCVACTEPVLDTPAAIHHVQPSAKPSPMTVIGVRTSSLLRFGVIDVIVRVVRAVSAMMLKSDAL